MPKLNSSVQKYTKPYNDETLQVALDEIKRGAPKLLVAKKYGIPRATLQFRLSTEFTKIRHGPNTYLTEVEEKLLVKWVKDSHRKGFPRRPEDICSSVKNFLDENPRKTPFKDNTPGSHWYRSFLGRHPEITSRTPESVTKASGNVAEPDIRKWFANIEQYLKEKEFFDILEDPSRVYNGDETCFHLCPKTGKVLAPRGAKNVYEVDQGNSKANITVMFIFSAAGGITPPMVIYPYKKYIPPHIAENFPVEWGMGISENGWMKSEMFYEYVANILYPYLKKKAIRFPIIYFVDGHKTHLTYQVSKLCSELGIVLIALYPNATRILQPADVSCFRPLKAAWKHGVLKWRRNNPFSEINKSSFAPILKDVLFELTVEKISNGFKACGFFPWNVNSVDFSKCIGKNKGPQGNVSQEDILPTASINFQQLSQLVGKTKLKTLQEFTKNEDSDTSNLSEDALILLNIYKEFFRDVENLQVEPVNDDFNEHNHNYRFNEQNIPGMPNKESNVSYSADEILNIPIVILPENERPNQTCIETTSLNDNLENYLLWQRTPERTGKKQTERLPYIITSTAFKNVCEEKMRAKTEKELEKARKQAIRNEKKKTTEIKTKKTRKNQNQSKSKIDNTLENCTVTKLTSEVPSKKINILQNILINPELPGNDQDTLIRKKSEEESCKRFLFADDSDDGIDAFQRNGLDLRNNTPVCNGLALFAQIKFTKLT